MPRHQPSAAPTAAGRRFRRLVALWRARASERQALAVMTDRELRDIGISPGEAIAEARKPFWTA